VIARLDEHSEVVNFNYVIMQV
jgi:isocitrate/isopropylmalate dehydrogenase